jgi:hypothetical protein
MGYAIMERVTVGFVDELKKPFVNWRIIAMENGEEIGFSCSCLAFDIYNRKYMGKFIIYGLMKYCTKLFPRGNQCFISDEHILAFFHDVTK